MRCTTVLAVYPLRLNMESARRTAASAHPLQVTAHPVILHCRSTSNSKTIRSVTMCFRLQLCCPRCFPLSEKRVGRIRTRTSHLLFSTRILDGFQFQLSGKSSAGRMAFRCMCMQIDERPHRLPDQCLLNVRKTTRNSKKDEILHIFLFFSTNILQIFQCCRS